MFTSAQLICCLIVPAFLAFALGSFRRDMIRPAGLGGGILILAATFGHLANAVSVGDALMPPRDGWHWSILASLILTLTVLVLPLGAPQSKTRRLMSYVAHGLAAAFGAWLLLRPLVSLPATTILAWSAGLGVATALTSSLVQSALPPSGRSAWLGLAAAAAGTAAGVLAGGSKDIGLFAATLASAAAGMALRGGNPIAAGAAVIPMAWFLLIGVHYASLHPASAAILLLAPLGITAAQLPPIARRPWVAWVTRIAVPLVIAGLGIATGLILAPHEDASGY